MICDLSSNISDFFNVNNVFFLFNNYFSRKQPSCDNAIKETKDFICLVDIRAKHDNSHFNRQENCSAWFQSMIFIFLFPFFFFEEPLNATFISRDMFWIKELKITTLMIFWPNNLFFIYLKAFKILVYVSLGSM